MKNSGGFARILSLAATLAAALISAVFWINNLAGAWRYHAALFAGSHSAGPPDGLFVSLSWSAIDVSTVTTFIPFFGFALMFLGLLRPRQSADWPFFPGYDRLNIALGLIGTLWGIILIGYYPAAQVTISALMSCLHTAMFSTLAAILWIMVLKPLLLQPWMDCIRKTVSGAADNDVELDDLVGALSDSLAAAAGEFGSTADGARNFRLVLAGFEQELAALKEQFARFNADLEQQCEERRRWQQQTLECLRALTETAESFREQQQTLQTANRDLTLERDALHGKLAAAEEETVRLQRRIEAIRETLR